MFVQIIKGKVSEAGRLRERSDVWNAELRAGATGFLGSTGGVTAAGDAVLIARFADRAAAEANSQRPEQGEWWSETERIFEGTPSFADSDDVDLIFGGGSDDAGFVQVMEGTVDDRAALGTFEEQLYDRLQQVRPEVLGVLRVWHDDGRFTDVVYFSSEAEARSGEGRMADELGEAWQRYTDLVHVESYYDLADPVLT